MDFLADCKLSVTFGMHSTEEELLSHGPVLIFSSTNVEKQSRLILLMSYSWPQCVHR